MWLWIAIGIASYVVAMVAIVAIAGSARRADRQERAIFARWIAERRLAAGSDLRHPRPRAA